MNRFFLYIILFFLTHSLLGQQNLVPNGSFEEYSECPTGNELNNGQFERAIGWFRPTFGTPDYYHRCNNSGTGNVGVPNNFWGYQEPYEGDGYVGFVPIEWTNTGDYIFGGEYFRTKLKETLKPCTKYKFTMYVSLANFSTHGVSRLGVWLSDDNATYSYDTSLLETPYIEYHGTPIMDTTTWVLVEGSFISDDFHQYLTIGYFHNVVTNDTILNEENPLGNAPYYYVDNVSLYEISQVPEDICDIGQLSFPNIITPNKDNSNDFLDASSYFVITDEIIILNRWGNVIELLTKENPIWDGRTINGKPCTEGTYFYKFDYQWGDKVKQKSGFIHLVR